MQPQRVELTTSTIQQLESPLNELLNAASPTFKVALVGIGHPLRSDDYVGSYVTKEIIKANCRRSPDRVYVFDAEDNVERVISRISRIHPRYVIFIDACEMGLRPAEMKLMSVDEIGYPFFTTHGIPLKVLAEQLPMGCKVWVLGIQPRDTGFGEGLSPEVNDAADHLCKFVASSLAKEDRGIV